jgi:hypothetical protein
MKTEAANKLIDKAIEIVDKKGLDHKAIEEVLKEAREFAKQEEDPLVTKTLRLICEYIDENEAFDIEVKAEEEEEDEEEEFEQEEMTDTENLQYLLALIKKSDNAYNREEIKGYRTELWEAIY